MAWNGVNLAYSVLQINASVPSVSGVYAIWNATQWLYVGESNDVRRRLLEHLQTSTHINQYGPTTCGYELSPTQNRVSRQNALILELKPLCNERLG